MFTWLVFQLVLYRVRVVFSVGVTYRFFCDGFGLAQVQDMALSKHLCQSSAGEKILEKHIAFLLEIYGVFGLFFR